MPRFTPSWRRAMDGQVYACVYDNKNMEFSTLTCFGKYYTLKECQYAIDKYSKEWKLKEE